VPRACASTARFDCASRTQENGASTRCLGELRCPAGVSFDVPVAAERRIRYGPWRRGDGGDEAIRTDARFRRSSACTQNEIRRRSRPAVASDYSDFAGTCLLCTSNPKNNWKSLTNYAYAYRHGLRISSAPAKSGMAHLVNRRMGKKQSMRWSAEGAHRLLQVRCAVLDGQLANFFREWFPGFRENPGSFERAM
jgi:hypothetical protein